MIAQKSEKKRAKPFFPTKRVLNMLTSFNQTLFVRLYSIISNPIARDSKHFPRIFRILVINSIHDFCSVHAHVQHMVCYQKYIRLFVSLGQKSLFFIEENLICKHNMEICAFHSCRWRKPDRLRTKMARLKSQFLW